MGAIFYQKQSAPRFEYSTEIIPQTMDLSVYLPRFESGEIDADLISAVVQSAYDKRRFMAKMWSWYVGHGDPILYRKYIIDGVEQKDKINNKINSDFVGRIVSTKTGYLFGNDVSYFLDKGKYSGVGERMRQWIGNPQYRKDSNTISDWIIAESFRDQQVEMGKYATVCGQAGRLLWHDEANAIHSYIVRPWECLFITDGEIYDAAYSMRIYDVVTDYTTGEYVTFVEVYTPSDRIVFKGAQSTTGDSVQYELDAEMSGPHGFKYNPLIGYANNREIQGDCEKVLNRILDYERIMSDTSSELEQMRLAYMVFRDVDIDAKTVKQMKQTGALKIKTTGQNTNADVYFLTKKLDIAGILEYTSRAKDDINADSGTVDLSDPNFYTTLSAVAIKMRTMALENKSKLTESKFRAANRKMWRIITDFWRTIGAANIDYLAIKETWTRNLPYNKLEEAQTLAMLRGNLSDQTVFANSVFVNDPDEEILNMSSEGLEMVKDDGDSKNGKDDGANR